MPRKSARITWLTTTLAGSPVVGRNIWYDYGDVALIVDWAEASSAHNYTISFNLPGTASTVGGVLSDGSIQTQHSSGNVKVAPLLRTGQTAARGPLPITTAPTATFGFATPGGEGDGWLISTVDSAGDVGRFTSIQLDPNYPKSSDVVIAYENTSSGSFKYAAQFRGGWKTLTIDDDTTMGGGYISLQFRSKRDADGRYQPTVSYYDAGNTALKFAL